jgi:hypothetical protein
MNRKAIAGAVLLLWAGGFLWMLRRNTGGDVSRRLTEAALRVQPASFYFTLSYRGEKIGAASSVIDTLPATLVAEEYYAGKFPSGDSLISITARLRSGLTRAFRLTNISLQIGRNGTMLKSSAFIQNDTTLILTDRAGGDSTASHIIGVHSALLTPVLVPVALMLGDAAKVGRGERFVVFNPVDRKPEAHSVRIGRDSLFMVVDSAERKADGSWSVAHTDTVRAWQVAGDTNGVTAWVDRDGRVVEASTANGLSLMRTAYELAFERVRRK